MRIHSMGERFAKSNCYCYTFAIRNAYITFCLIFTLFSSFCSLINTKSLNWFLQLMVLLVFTLRNGLGLHLKAKLSISTEIANIQRLGQRKLSHLQWSLVCFTQSDRYSKSFSLRQVLPIHMSPKCLLIYNVSSPYIELDITTCKCFISFPKFFVSQSMLVHIGFTNFRVVPITFYPFY